jgi:hypothetical protein
MDAVRILGLVGIAIAQPLYSLLAENPTYLVAHDATASDIVLLALLILLVPTTVLVGVILFFRLVMPRIADIAMAILAGLLGTLAIFSVIDAVNAMSAGAFLATLTAGTILVTVLYIRFRAPSLFALYLGAAPLLFVGMFLFASPVKALVLRHDPSAIVSRDTLQSPVVFVVFDELPLGALLLPDGRLDTTRFPGFARLAATSTWYPSARTVAPWTHLAVPAALTGRLPDPARPPVAGQYPRSLFTMLGSSHDMHVSEQITSLCPRSLCQGSRPTDQAVDTLAIDTGIVVLHQLLPDSVAERLLPSISDQWMGFGESDVPTELPKDDLHLDFERWEARVRSDKSDSSTFAAFLESVGTTGGSGLWYQHELLPHMPFKYLPDGRTYPGGIPGSLSADHVFWNSEPLAIVNAQQRMLLQPQYVDLLVDELLTKLEHAELLDSALVVVMSDHGITFEPDSHRRGISQATSSTEPQEADMDVLTDTSRDAVIPIPLFIKYPRQRSAVIDSRKTELIDVLPTLADVLNVRLPDDWTFDGKSLLTPPGESSLMHWVDEGGAREIPDMDAIPTRTSQIYFDLVGASGGRHDVYSVGPYGSLVGREVTALLGAGEAGAVIVSADPEALRRVDLAGSSIPAMYSASVAGIEAGSWLALGLNGTIAGVGPTFTHRDGHPVVEIMIDPSLMVQGLNDVELFLIEGTPPRLQPVTER